MASRLKKEIEADEKLLKDLRSRFLRAFRGEQKWREHRKEWNRFYDGDQLTEEEKTALRERGQPEVVINRIKPKIDSLVGLELSLPVNIKAYNRKTGTFDEATHISEALRWIEQANDFDSKESVVFEKAIKSGRAWYKTTVEWDDLEADTKTHAPDPEFIYLDPYSRKENLEDAKDIHETVWMDLEDAKELFPDAADDLETLVLSGKDENLTVNGVSVETRPNTYESEYKGSDEFSSVFVDCKRRRVRLVTTWYRTPYRTSFITASGLGTQDATELSPKDIKKIKESFPDAQEWNEIKYRLNTATFIMTKILERKENVRPWDKKAKFPFVMFQCYETDDERHMPYGLIKQMMDPQREINKRRSKLLHLLNTNTLIAEKGTFDKPNEAREQLNRPDGLLQPNQGFQWKVERNIEVAQSQFQLLQESKSEIDIVGVNRELEGDTRPASSGRLFQLRQEQALSQVRKLFLNLRAARRRVAYLWLDDIQQFWTEERLLKVDDDPASQPIVLNQRVVQPDGSVTIENNLSVGKYDLIIDEAPDTINLQSEQFDKLVQLASSGVPIPPDMVIEASSLPNKDELLERLKEQQQMQQQMQMAQLQLQAHGQAQGQPVQR